MEIQLPSLLGIYDRPTNQPTEMKLFKTSNFKNIDPKIFSQIFLTKT